MGKKVKGGRFKESTAKRGRPHKEVYLNINEFIEMVNFIKKHPIDKQKYLLREADVPIPDTGRAYWYHAMGQVLECLKYIKETTPLTSAKMVMHDKKLEQYPEGDNRIEVYEYIRTQIIEANGGSKKLHYDKEVK